MQLVSASQSNEVEENITKILQVLIKISGNTDFVILKDDVSFKKVGNDLPRALSTTALVHAFMYQKMEIENI
jgi:hypothetical protein